MAGTPTRATVGDGIGRAEQLERLRELGCTCAVKLLIGFETEAGDRELVAV